MRLMFRKTKTASLRLTPPRELVSRGTIISSRAGGFFPGGFDKLLFPSYGAVIARIMVALIASFLTMGFFFPYWWYADQDLILAYQGLLLNDGRPQEYFDHTGYLYVLAISGWYWLCHWVGLLPVHRLSELPPGRDVAAFELAWQHLVEAGRVLSLLLAGLFVWTFAALLRRLLGDWRIAAMAGLALAFSASFAMHMRYLRTELLSSALVTTALLAVLLAARTKAGIERRSLLLALGGLCAALAVVTKVQAIFPAMAIPIIALAFGQKPARRTDLRENAKAWRCVAVIALAALATGVPAGALFLRGLAETGQSIFPYQPLGLVPAGTYQALIATAIAVAMMAYAMLWRVPVVDTAAAMAAVIFGISLGLLSIALRFHEQNLLAVTHPIEHMFYFASWASQDLAHEPQILSQSLFALLWRGFHTAMETHTPLAHPWRRPTFLLEWLAIAGAVVLWRRGERAVPLRIALLLLVAWGLDTLFTLRGGFRLEYFVYTDPLLIIAAALAAAYFPELQKSVAAQMSAVVLFGVIILWAHVEPKRGFALRIPSAAPCVWLPIYLKAVDRFPFCSAA
jgi:hypothetical protein